VDFQGQLLRKCWLACLSNLKSLLLLKKKGAFSSGKNNASNILVAICKYTHARARARTEEKIITRWTKTWIYKFLCNPPIRVSEVNRANEDFMRFAQITVSNVVTAVVRSSSQGPSGTLSFAGESNMGRLFTLRITSILPFSKFSCNDTL